MRTSLAFSLIFIALVVLSTKYCSAVVGDDDVSNSGGGLVSALFIDSTAGDKRPVNFQCRFADDKPDVFPFQFKLTNGEVFHSDLPETRGFLCIVSFGGKSITLAVYDPKRDAGHTGVFTKADTVGLYHSYDGKNWSAPTKWN